VRKEGPDIAASDIDPEAVRLTRENARRAGVSFRVEERPIRDLSATKPPGVVVVNPPYGERLVGGEGLYREMAEVFARLSGHRICVLAGTPAVERAIGRPPDKWLILFNGPIECRLLIYDY
jgi:putative N6-adenine-specific DNA methylase